MRYLSYVTGHLSVLCDNDVTRLSYDNDVMNQMCSKCVTFKRIDVDCSFNGADHDELASGRDSHIL